MSCFTADYADGRGFKPFLKSDPKYSRSFVVKTKLNLSLTAWEPSAEGAQHNIDEPRRIADK
jgi:hypothetical protein